jgi:outer membrane protein OmpA-like peptidoglycan-associated protein/outer membrane protein W
MRSKLAWLACSMLALPIAARAQVVDGLYIGAGAGLNLLEPEQLHGLGALLPHGYAGHPKFSFDAGVAAIGSIGYGLGNGLRFEVEGGYRNNAIDRVGGAATKSGTSEKASAMVNALYDFDLTQYYGITAFTPYVGAGVGYAYDDITRLSSFAGGDAIHIHGASDQFAYQAIVGVAFPLTDLVPGLSLTAEYRFFGTSKGGKFATHAVSGKTVAFGDISASSDLNNSIMLGLRYAFAPAPGAPPPPPAPLAAPAPAPSRTYLVFFDWDKSNLTARARQIVADAAANAGRVSYTRIEVNGNADRSGTPQYNMGLSLRRAQAVAAELVHDGVRQNMIDIHAYGDTRPLVPTAAGVREPQNRRVEIIIR